MGERAQCPDCKSYPPLKSGPWGMYYHCQPCDTMVGCHRGTTNPKGRMASKHTRALRIAAHAAFDPLWQQEHMTRKEAYAWLGGLLGLKKGDCHIAMMSDEHLFRTAELCALRLIELHHSNRGATA